MQDSFEQGNGVLYTHRNRHKITCQNSMKITCSSAPPRRGKCHQHKSWAKPLDAQLTPVVVCSKTPILRRKTQTVRSLCEVPVTTRQLRRRSVTNFSSFVCTVKLVGLFQYRPLLFVEALAPSTRVRLRARPSPASIHHGDVNTGKVRGLCQLSW